MLRDGCVPRRWGDSQEVTQSIKCGAELALWSANPQLQCFFCALCIALDLSLAFFDALGPRAVLVFMAELSSRLCLGARLCAHRGGGRLPGTRSRSASVQQDFPLLGASKDYRIQQSHLEASIPLSADPVDSLPFLTT